MKQTYRLSSSAISHCAYDPDDGALEVTFVNGDTYTHAQVPPDVAQGLVEATSPGRYWNSAIKGQY
jgi:hypothetical protein